MDNPTARLALSLIGDSGTVFYTQNSDQTLFPTLRKTQGFEDAQVFAIGGARLHTLTAALESELSIRGAGPER